MGEAFGLRRAGAVSNTLVFPPTPKRVVDATDARTGGVLGVRMAKVGG